MSADKLHADLTKLWKDDASINIPKVEELIMQIKVAVVTAGLKGDKALFQYQDALEKDALLSIHKRDLKGFERGIKQVLNFYNQNEGRVKESPRKAQMLGLNLMYLISTSKKAQFHMELERLSGYVFDNDPFIQWPHKLEQYMMEGAYNNIFMSKKNAPSSYYLFFMELMIETVRIEIGKCMKKTYKTLSVKEATRMLFFDSQKEMIQFAKNNNWRLSSDQNEFLFPAVTSHKDIPAEPFSCIAPRLATQLIEYAKQLEMIV